MPNKVSEAEVRWYSQHGRFRHRIVRDSEGAEYVIGDWSWNRRMEPCSRCNRRLPGQAEGWEVIEPEMRDAIAEHSGS